MVIATFGPSTAWEGKQITLQDGRLILEDHGPVGPADVMEYDRQGHLVWASEGTRAWVGSKAATAALGGGGLHAARRLWKTAGSSEPDAAEHAAHGGEPERTVRLKRLFLVAIGVLVVANAALLLMILGVIPHL